MSNANPFWLHISDLHSGNDNFGFQQLSKNLLKFLEEKKNINNITPNLIFFSGDIANKGRPEEYSAFNDNLLYPLLEFYGDDIENNILFVPGNHDVDRTISPLLNTHSLYNEHKTLFDNTEEATRLREALANRFSAFRAALPNFKDTEDLLGKSTAFTRTFLINGVNVGVVGINTAWLCQNDCDKEHLAIGKYGLEEGLATISSCSLRIVIGHHPIDWLNEEEKHAIGSIFAQNNVIYLHGHMHENSAIYTEKNGGQFLTFQAGAIFESRDSKNRPNTIIFGEFNKENGKIIITPYAWNPKNNEWALDSQGLSDTYRPHGESRWHFSLPKSKKNTTTKAKNKSLGLPVGWIELTNRSLTAWAPTDHKVETLLSFFNGRPPRWADAASMYIPHRKSVVNLANDVIDELETAGSSFFLITGAGGEGKSTALRQTCCILLRRCPDLHILFRNEDECNLPSHFILNSLSSEKKWLIVADEGSNLIEELHFQQQILGKSEAHISYIIASRDTDWIANRGKAYAWPNITRYKEINMKGLCIEDARLIVSAWHQCGKEGLQKLQGYSSSLAAEMLVQASKHEDQDSEGSFLGAMLAVRYGSELKQHINTVLSRLQPRQCIAGRSLLESFAAITAIDRLRLSILSKEILANFLGCKDSEIRKHVLTPLGDEALVTIAGGYLLTRHRLIADTAYDLLETNYNTDFTEVYKQLVLAALKMIADGKYVSNVKKWRYLSRDLFSRGDYKIAIEVAKTVLSSDPQNSYFVVQLASLHRESGNNELALTTFRTSKIESANNRGFFTEWAAAERNDKNYFAAVWLTVLAINDMQSSKDVTNDDAKMALTELCICGRAIHKEYNLDTFLSLAIYSQHLALALPINSEEVTHYKNLLNVQSYYAHLNLTNTLYSTLDEVKEKVLIRCANDAKSRCERLEFLPHAINGISIEQFLSLVKARPAFLTKTLFSEKSFKEHVQIEDKNK